MAENGNMRGGLPFAYGEHGAGEYLRRELEQERLEDQPRTPVVFEEGSAFPLPQIDGVISPGDSEEPKADK